MKYPFFASFIVFCIWLGYELHKHKNLDAKRTQEFWEKEAVANNTRKQSLADLNYIQIPFDQLPMDVLSDNPQIAEYHQMLRELSESPIVNFTGISNTELKLQYGAPNLELLSRYDQSYTLLARTLQDWAASLYEQNYVVQARDILTFAMETRTDVSASYKLLASIYRQEGTPEKIQDLISIAESLNSVMKKHILKMLKEIQAASTLDHTER